MFFPCFALLFLLVAYMKDLERVEKERGIRPDPEIDAYMKVVIVPQEKRKKIQSWIL